MLSNENNEKFCHKYYCNICDYGTSKKSSYNDHILSSKHQKSTFSNDILPKFCPNYECQNCNKKYKDNSGLWRHKQKCKNLKETNHNNNLENNGKIIDTIDKDELILMLIKQNSELIKETSECKHMMMKVIENGTHNTNISNVNSHNKAFNLNFFLNETCKDAMNITEFVDSIKLQLSDLEKVGELGYVNGISNIIVKNLKELDVTQRPVHCTDKKRETLYIKDENKWEKDDDKKKLRKVIKRVASKNQRLLLKFKEVHPDCNTSSSKYSDQYNTIIVESMGGSGDNDLEKEEKIMRNILKQVVIDKEN
jgi:hypothetical protein